MWYLLMFTDKVKLLVIVLLFKLKRFLFKRNYFDWLKYPRIYPLLLPSEFWASSFVVLGSYSWCKQRVEGEVMTPSSRRQHTAVLYNGVMYVYGGYIDLKGSTSQLWAFDLGKKTQLREVGM